MLNIKKMLMKILQTLGNLTGVTTERWVDLSSYTYASPYTAPKDGYVFIYNQTANNSYVEVRGDNNNGTIALGTTAGGRNCMYIRKGMRLSVSGTFQAVRFTPIGGGSA